MVNWNAEKERVNELLSSNKPKNDDIINLDDVKTIEIREDTFQNKDGTENISVRFIYKMMNGKEIVVPATLHKKISALKVEYDDKLSRIKVVVEGAGLKTKYDAMPLLIQDWEVLGFLFFP